MATACSGANTIIGLDNASSQPSSSAENAEGQAGSTEVGEGGVEFEEAGASPAGASSEADGEGSGSESDGGEGQGDGDGSEGMDGSDDGDDADAGDAGDDGDDGDDVVDECQTLFDTYGLPQDEIKALNAGNTANDFDVAIWGTHGGADGSKQSALLALAPIGAMSLSVDDLVYIIEDDDANTIAPVLAMHKVSDRNKGHDQVFDNLFISDANQNKLRIVVKTLNNGAYVYKGDTKWPIDGSKFVGNPEGAPAITSARKLVDSADIPYTNLMPHIVLGDAPDTTGMIQFGNPSARPLKIAESTDSSWASLQIKLKFESTVAVSYTKNPDNTWTASEGPASGSTISGTFEIDVRTILNKPLAAATVNAGNSYGFDLLAGTGNNSLLAEHNLFVISVKDSASGYWYRYYYFLG